MFLRGIHAVGPVVYGQGEARLIAGLRAALPRGRVVQVFPYSVTNRALTGQRPSRSCGAGRCAASWPAVAWARSPAS